MELLVHINVYFTLEKQPVVVDVIHPELIHPLFTVNHETKHSPDIQVGELLRALVIDIVLVGIESSDAHAKWRAHVVDTPYFDWF